MFSKDVGRKYVSSAVFVISLLVLGYIFLYIIMITKVQNIFYMFMIKSVPIIQRNVFIKKGIYYPGDSLPLETLNRIRNSSHEKLKRSLSTKEYNQFKDLMTDVVNIFKHYNIRYNN